MQLAFKVKRFVDPKNPSLFMVHGRGGNINVMDIFIRCIPEDFNIISIESPFSDPIGGYSWWRVDTSEDYSKSLNIIEENLRDIVKEFGLDETKLHGMGFSQGGAILSCILQKNACFFDSVLMLASFVPEIINLKISEKNTNLKYTKILLINGTTDEIVSKDKATKSNLYLQKIGFESEQFFEDVGHKIGREGMKKIKEWFNNI